jgi:UDP-N-acetylmuramoyl-L-alanyl-D-glutamate--2,6-diaminopimelate ligase
MTRMTTQARPVSLAWLVDGIVSLDAVRGAGADPAAVQVADLALDSREVLPGDLFFALAGRQRHGLEFAAEAAARGASAVLWEPAAGVSAPQLPATLVCAPVVNLSQLLGRIADRFFQWPSQYLRICGFTGTNGKTTCAYLLAQCLQRLGSPCAYIGTLGIGRIAALETATHTTPDVIRMHRTLAALRAQGIRDVTIEVSSHALDQGRVAGVRFFCAAFTNLTRDHLDYHESMEAYGAAKARLFALPELQHLVVNVGDAFGRGLAERHSGPVSITAVQVGSSGYGWLGERSLRVTRVSPDAHGLSLVVDGSFGPLDLRSKLIGRFNAENLVVVLACLVAFGIAASDAAEALGACTAAPGRMEAIASKDGAKPLVVIDYAHTPDALAKALGALREHCGGALWCVFGCGGDRDSGKRALMGAIADELADRIIVTDDNPRSENPAAITAAIASGIKSHPIRIIHDRGEAIGAALAAAAALDVVLIAGKGHEDYQIYGDRRRAFSDRSEAMRHLGVAA